MILHVLYVILVTTYNSEFFAIQTPCNHLRGWSQLHLRQTTIVYNFIIHGEAVRASRSQHVGKPHVNCSKPMLGNGYCGSDPVMFCLRHMYSAQFPPFALLSKILILAFCSDIHLLFDTFLKSPFRQLRCSHKRSKGCSID